MKIVLCDDEPYFLDVITDYCIKFEQEYGIPIALIKFVRGEDVLLYYQQDKNVDLFILDIMMDEIDGLQVADEIRKNGMNTKIVFVTSAIKFAPEGYTYGAIRYWLKPLSYEKFSLEMQVIYEIIRKESNSYIIENTGKSIEKVYYDDIIYIETQSRKAYVHRASSDYISKTKLIEYERKLDERFFRCHSAYIVNMDYIIKIVKLEIHLSTGKKIYMSKGKKKKFMSALGIYLRKNIK